MSKRIVIALGGNALGNTAAEQLQLVTETAKAIVDLIEAGNEVVVAHGNGPQVGMIQNAFAAYHKQQAKSDIMPLSNDDLGAVADAGRYDEYGGRYKGTSGRSDGDMDTGCIVGVSGWHFVLCFPQWIFFAEVAI